MNVSRTFLFTPGNHTRRVEKALSLDVDAVILDLEDAVATSEKVASRDLVTSRLALLHGPRGYVRMNALDTAFAFGDLQAIVRPGVDGIVLPKLESVEQLHCADWIITQLERERGLPEGGIDLMPIIENGAGFAQIEALGQAARTHSRVHRFAFGAGDFTLDMNLTWTPDELELLPYRSRLVLASRAAGLEPPIDTVWVRLDDADGFARSARRAQGMGFQGKLCIHPSQCDVVNETFAPAAADVTRARAVIEAFEHAEARGVASIQLDGEFIDYPIVYRARRTLDLAQRITASRARPG
jgi:citrate lyase subunit beta/citryl-CoA lyase